MNLNIAIVGSGPAGMYLLEALLKLIPASFSIDVIDRLPTPFGLIRSGVAPDHGSVRAVMQRFEKALARPGVRFVGGVEIGRELPLAVLRDLYDVVVLANGCPLDKQLGIAGEDLPGVWGSARFTGWYNAHPDHADLDVVDLPETVVVIGNGNVAVDVARLLTKSASTLSATDISHAAMQVLLRSSVRKVVLAGRRAPADAHFSVKELEELGEHADVSVSLPAGVALPASADIEALPPAQSSMLQALAAYSASAANGRTRHIEFQFLSRPVAVIGRECVEAVRFERMACKDSAVHGTGTYFDVACGAVVTCIGYRARPLEALDIHPHRGGFEHDDARIGPGLYCTGWARRGPSGTIATNRSDASQVAKRICLEVQAGGRRGPAGLDLFLAQRGLRYVSLADWHVIDGAERARATDGAPRKKFHSVADMMTAINSVQG
jgi:NADPH-dependent glutamate synthase beta subunit-like oxidoreductase